MDRIILQKARYVPEWFLFVLFYPFTMLWNGLHPYKFSAIFAVPAFNDR